MKLTKFFAASLAAMTLFSCSKELTETPEDVLNPGDVRVEVNIGKTVTTYANEADELLVKNHMYALYSADGLTKINVTPDATAGVGKISFTVAAADVTAHPNAILVVVANTANFTSNGADAITEMPATLAEAKIMTIQGALSDVDAGLPNGIPASHEYAVSLSGGAPVVLSEKLQRVASRIFVKSNGGNDYTAIAGYTIAYKSAVSTNLVGGAVVVTAAQSAATSYIVKATAPEGSYKGTQAVGYVYPSTAAQGSFSVTNREGVVKTIGFAAAANKNYAVNIVTTTTGADGTVTFDLSIDAWDATDGGDTNIDFATELDFQRTSPSAGVDGLSKPADVKSKILAVIELLPGQHGTIPISVPTGLTLVSTDGATISVSGSNVFVNPGSGAAFEKNIAVQKNNQEEGVITFIRPAVTEVNFSTINVFKPYLLSGALSAVNITNSNTATITLTNIREEILSFAIPTSFKYRLDSGTGIVAATPTANDWATVTANLPHFYVRNAYEANEAVYSILDANDAVVASFTVKRPAKVFDFSTNGVAGVPGVAAGANFFRYESKDATSANIVVESNAIFNAKGAGYLKLNDANVTAEVEIIEGPTGWMRVEGDAHRVVIARDAASVKAVAKFTYKSKVNGIVLGTSTWTREALAPAPAL